uniref:Uncharacterized protein n=1 Tax=Taeniopygia guttata TaxID=59729 RepID=A0A674GZ70_TAEGU
MLWLGQGHAFSFSISPVHVRALASSLCGDERKMSLMSCAAELSARGCCMGVLSLHCTLMVLQWSFSSCLASASLAARTFLCLKY